MFQSPSRKLQKEERQRLWDIHKTKLKEIEGNKAQYLQAPASYKHLGGKYLPTHLQLFDLQKSNKSMIGKLVSIIQSNTHESQTHTGFPKTSSSQASTLYGYQKSTRQIEIQLENQKLLQRLKNIQSVFDIKRWENDRKQTEKYVAMHCELAKKLISPESVHQEQLPEFSMNFSQLRSKSSQERISANVSIQQDANEKKPITILFEQQAKIVKQFYYITIFLEQQTFCIRTESLDKQKITQQWPMDVGYFYLQNHCDGDFELLLQRLQIDEENRKIKLLQKPINQVFHFQNKDPNKINSISTHLKKGDQQVKKDYEEEDQYKNENEVYCQDQNENQINSEEEDHNFQQVENQSLEIQPQDNQQSNQDNQQSNQDTSISQNVEKQKQKNQNKQESPTDKSLEIPQQDQIEMIKIVKSRYQMKNNSPSLPVLKKPIGVAQSKVFNQQEIQIKPQEKINKVKQLPELRQSSVQAVVKNNASLSKLPQNKQQSIALNSKTIEPKKSQEKQNQIKESKLAQPEENYDENWDQGDYDQEGDDNKIISQKEDQQQKTQSVEKDIIEKEFQQKIGDEYDQVQEQKEIEVEDQEIEENNLQEKSKNQQMNQNESNKKVIHSNAQKFKENPEKVQQNNKNKPDLIQEINQNTALQGEQQEEMQDQEKNQKLNSKGLENNVEENNNENIKNTNDGAVYEQNQIKESEYQQKQQVKQSKDNEIPATQIQELQIDNSIERVPINQKLKTKEEQEIIDDNINQVGIENEKDQQTPIQQDDEVEKVRLNKQNKVEDELGEQKVSILQQVSQQVQIEQSKVEDYNGKILDNRNGQTPGQEVELQEQIQYNQEDFEESSELKEENIKGKGHKEKVEQISQQVPVKNSNKQDQIKDQNNFEANKSSPLQAQKNSPPPPLPQKEESDEYSGQFDDN